MRVTLALDVCTWGRRSGQRTPGGGVDLDLAVPEDAPRPWTVEIDEVGDEGVEAPWHQRSAERSTDRLDDRRGSGGRVPDLTDLCSRRHLPGGRARSEDAQVVGKPRRRRPRRADELDGSARCGLDRSDDAIGRV